MGYNRMNIFEEDKWDIHSSSYRQERYASNESKASAEYKHEHYSSKAEKDADKVNEDYRKNDAEEKKGKEKGNAPSIEDSLREEKEKKERIDEQDTFKIAAQEIHHEFQQHNNGEVQINKKNGNKSIEEAISKAIKVEKEVIIVAN